MKTLANCTPREFLKQTNRIRLSADKWLTATKVLEIRRRMPELPKPAETKDRDELQKAIEGRREAFADQARENLFAILEAMLDTNADETLELLALCCFVEPEDVDKHTMSEYLANIGELMTDAGVVSFFDSLVRLGVSSMANTVTR
jgi:hypothetical protein